MKMRAQSCFKAILFACILVIDAKIVYLNGTEIPDNAPSFGSVKVRFMINPQNISNHSGDKSPVNLSSRKKDAEKQAVTTTTEDTANVDDVSNITMATRDTTILSNIRGAFRDLNPAIKALSTVVGLFIAFILVQSPLSPLPVPPLPYPPIGPFPPTNRYPFGIPNSNFNRNEQRMRYIPPSPGGPRIPRMQELNVMEALENVVSQMERSAGENSTPKKVWTTSQLDDGQKQVLFNLSSILENRSSIPPSDIVPTILQELKNGDKEQNETT